MSSISPEHWHFIPFATDIDLYGGKSVPVEKTQIKPFFVTQETSRGELQMRYVEGKFNLLAVDLGVGLLYSREGILETVGVNVMQYCENLHELDIEKMGGEKMERLLEKMVLNGDRLYLDVELKEGVVAVVSINEESGERKTLFSATEVDFRQRSLVTVEYGDQTLLIGFSNNADEFEIGLMAEEGDVDDLLERKISLLITVICSDLNYKTFLNSKNEDRFERLARRVFS